MDESLSTKIRYEEAYQEYIKCLTKSPEKNPECIEIIKRYHYLLEIKNIKNKVFYSQK